MKPPRALALDALRGFAIIGMVLSGSVTFNGSLPAWMFHAQVPPPAYRFNPALPGITWVDLVFPFFLFALGAAIPLAFANRSLPTNLTFTSWREYGGKYGILAVQILKRGLLLAFFAIFTQHARVFALTNIDAPAWLRFAVGVGAYALLFLVFVRFPERLVKSLSVKNSWLKNSWLKNSWLKNSWLANVLQASAVGLALGLVWVLPYPQSALGTAFNPARSDIILLVLSNVAVFGTALWLVTRTNPFIRLGLLAFYLALRLTQTEYESWNFWLWNATPATWLFKVYFLQYLFIVLPGTVAGELILCWLQEAKQHEPHESAQTVGGGVNAALAQAALALLTFAFIPVNLVGLYTRALWANLFCNLALIALGYWLFRREQVVNALNTLNTLHRALYNWGVYWLLLGLAFEAFEGGIKKDKSTLSYYFVTSGLAFFALITLSVWIDVFKRARWLQAVIDCGQNPMIAYVTGGLVLLPLLDVAGLLPLYNSTFAGAWLGFGRGVLFTSVVVLITQWFTRRSVFWRT